MDQKAKLTETLNQILRGDESAYDKLIAEHRPLVRAAIRYALNPGNRLRPFVTTQDIQQDLLMRLDKKARGSPSDEIKDGFSYLKKIAGNLVRDLSYQIRQDEAGRQIPLTLEIAEIIADRNPGPEEIVGNRDAAQHVFDHLTPKDRENTVRKMKGDTWAEIAGDDAERVQKVLQRRWAKLRDSCNTEE